MVKKILVNANEEKTDKILCAIMEKNGYRVCPKIRIADIFEVNKKKLGEKKFFYALGAHFDFTVVDNEGVPQFSVEFDGYYHDIDQDAQRKDQFKNEICLNNNYPLIRINAVFFREIGKFTLLSWLLEVWCAAQAFYEEQAKGNIPEDEDFDYWAVLDCSPDFKMRFPYNPFFKYRTYFHKLYAEKQILSGPQGITYKTPDGFEHCITVVAIDQEKALKQHFGVQSYAFFPVCDFELCENMNLLLICEKYLQYKKTNKGTINTKKAFSELNELSRKHNCSSFGQNCSYKNTSQVLEES